MRQPQASSASGDIAEASSAPVAEPSQDAADGAAARHGADQAAPAGRRMLDHEDDGGRVFAADRQALDHAQEREQDRRRHAQRLVAGQHADQEGRHRHRRHREGERGAPAERSPI